VDSTRVVFTPPHTRAVSSGSLLSDPSLSVRLALASAHGSDGDHLVDVVRLERVSWPHHTHRSSHRGRRGWRWCVRASEARRQGWGD
jgi:hypothetical protein